MNKLIIYTSTLHDSAGFPVCSLNGDLEFIIKSYQHTVDSANVSDDLKYMLKNGTIHLHSVTVAIIDDNCVKFNSTRTEKIDFVFNSAKIEQPFDVKQFSFVYKKEVKLINNIVNRLEKECKKTYDLLKKMEEEKHVDKENCN